MDITRQREALFPYLGHIRPFYGIIDIRSFRWGYLGLRVMEACIDDYGSCFMGLEVDTHALLNLRIAACARARLEFHDTPRFKGYVLLNAYKPHEDPEAGQVLLRFGTEYSDPFFPHFIFE